MSPHAASRSGAVSGAGGSGVRWNKVPEVTVYFWIVKVLCTTVGSSVAGYVDRTFGVGPTGTTLLFGLGLAIVMVGQFRLPHYVPGVYWLGVLLAGVVGARVTQGQIRNGVPVRTTTVALTLLLAAVLCLWWARERTLSLRTVLTRSREAWYWSAVLVAFALGTATGDWARELTRWPPGREVLLPLGVGLLVLVARRLGLGSVPAFWLAFVVTSPLGAALGDYLAVPQAAGGLDLGTLGTGVLFLGTILAVVVFLTVTDADRTEGVRLSPGVPGAVGRTSQQAR